MIAYFDTSALVPLVIEEDGTEACRMLWDSATRVVTATVTYAEARAAVAQANRLGRIASDELRAAVTALDELWTQLDLVEVDERLAQAAGNLAEAHGLRGYAAVHLAAAMELADQDLVVVAGDRAVLRAAQDEGMQLGGPGSQ